MAKVSTAIKRRNYNNRGMIMHRFVNDCCKVEADGTLWAYAVRSTVDAKLYRSDDNGFSWEGFTSNQLMGSGLTRWTAALDQEGPCSSVELIPDFGQVWVIEGGEDAFADYSVYFTVWDEDHATGDALLRNASQIGSDNEQTEGIFASCATNKTVFVLYRESTNADLEIRRCSPRTFSVSAAANEATYNYSNTFDCCVNKNGLVDVLCEAVDTVGGTTNAVLHTRYTEAGAFAAPSPININDTVDSKLVSCAIARDGNDNLGAVWAEDDAALIFWYAVSDDNGATWSGSSITPLGSADYVDSILTERDGRVDIIGGIDGGFLLTYVRDDASSVPKTYIHELADVDTTAANYTLDAGRLATGAGSASSVVGARFFKSEADGQQTLANKGFVRIMYQVGEGNSTGQDDRIPVSYDQERLEETAFPEAAETYTVDAPVTDELPLEINIIGGPSSNADFYSTGFTGSLTTKYLNAFKKLGVSVRLKKYEPNGDSIMNDRSSYGAVSDTGVMVVLDPSSYDFPNPSISADDYTSWVEQDIRQVYFPPDFHLSRTFTVNDGSFLKRTVWILEYDGNEYEVSQVVPFFLENQICYYSANAYVVGPSRDPWSRTVLTSET